MKHWIISSIVPDYPRSGNINNSIRYREEGEEATKGIWGWGSDRPPQLGRYNNGWHIAEEDIKKINIIPL